MRSPCRGCENEFEEKNKCMPACEGIRKYQEMLHRGNTGIQSNYLMPQDAVEYPSGKYVSSTPN